MRESFDRAILNEDTDIEDSNDNSGDNPFKELKNLISSKNIDVKTVLTEKQIIVNHKLNTLQNIFEKDLSESSQLCADMLEFFSNRYMTLVINKDGKSRSQFIEALHKGEDKVQQTRQLKINNGSLSL